MAAESPELTAPEGAFQLVSSVIDNFGGILGHSRTRRALTASPVSLEDLTPEAEQPGYFRAGLAQVLDELPTIRAAQPQPGERFVVVRFHDLPLNGPYRDYTFTISDRSRIIGLKATDPEAWVDWAKGEKPKLLTPPPLKDIFREINKALRLQPKLKLAD